jgi:hypothetical protein
VTEKTLGERVTSLETLFGEHTKTCDRRWNEVSWWLRGLGMATLVGLAKLSHIIPG